MDDMLASRLVPLDPARDEAAVAALCARAAAYIELESGETDPLEAARGFFEEAPPGDGAPPLKLGLHGEDGTLAAIADLALGFPEADVGYIGLLLIAPEARGRGLGKRLVAELEALATVRGARRLMLGVLEANPAARSFWERLGFRQVLTRTDVAIGDRVHTVHRLERPIGPA